MKVIVRDMIVLGVFAFTWIMSLVMCKIGQFHNLFEALLSFPGHALITIGYYAVLNVSYRVLFISDCQNEYKELMDDLDEGRKFFKEKGIKYN